MQTGHLVVCVNFVSVHFAETVSTDIALVDSSGSLRTKPYANRETLPGAFPAVTSFMTFTCLFSC